MPIVSMLEKIKNQLMTRFYTKNQEVEEMGGTVCPKIRKKLVKFEDLSNNYFALSAGKGLLLLGSIKLTYYRSSAVAGGGNSLAYLASTPFLV